MKTTVTQSAFIDAFKGGQYENNFSYSGLTTLYEYLEGYEDETGEQIEFDTVAIACEYSEYSLEDLCSQYQDIYNEFKADIEEEPTDDEILELFREHTQVIEIDGTSDVIIQDF